MSTVGKATIRDFEVVKSIITFQRNNEPTPENMKMFTEGFTKEELIRGYGTFLSVLASLSPMITHLLCDIEGMDTLTDYINHIMESMSNE